MLDKYGEEFERLYVEYESKTSIKKKKVKARDLWYKLMKERTETGNIYLFHEENVNEQSMLNRYVNSSNLCLKGDTIVVTTEGNKELQDVKIGDMIKSYNIDTKEVEYKKVTDFAQTSPKAAVMKITDEARGKSIICTPEHKVWTENRGYVEARYLKEDDILNIQ